MLIVLCCLWRLFITYRNYLLLFRSKKQLFRFFIVKCMYVPSWTKVTNPVTTYNIVVLENFGKFDIDLLASSVSFSIFFILMLIISLFKCFIIYHEYWFPIILFKVAILFLVMTTNEHLAKSMQGNANENFFSGHVKLTIQNCIVLVHNTSSNHVFSWILWAIITLFLECDLFQWWSHCSLPHTIKEYR